MVDEMTVRHPGESVKIGCTDMDDQKPPRRRYELKRRADEMTRTRRRITEAAVELHGSIGPARTTMSAIAERAGVQRHTVYRHFPDEGALLEACSAHYFASNPWPDIAAWRDIEDPRGRLARALDDLYAFYERGEPMLANVVRDAELVESVRTAMEPIQALMTEMVAILAAGWRPRSTATPARSLSATRGGVPHVAVADEEWRSHSSRGVRTRGRPRGERCCRALGMTGRPNRRCPTPSGGPS